MTNITRLQGSRRTLAPFYITSGHQESISTGKSISLECFHTKVYTDKEPIQLDLPRGFQCGLLKKITFVYKGDDVANVTVKCLGLKGGDTIDFTNVGDYILLLYTGGYWIILESLNSADPSSQSPTIS